MYHLRANEDYNVKIVLIDNFAKRITLIAENVNERYLDKIILMLNKSLGADSCLAEYFVKAADDYNIAEDFL